MTCEGPHIDVVSGQRCPRCSKFIIHHETLTSRECSDSHDTSTEIDREQELADRISIRLRGSPAPHRLNEYTRRFYRELLKMFEERNDDR